MFIGIGASLKGRHKAAEVLTRVLEIDNQGPGRSQTSSIFGSKRSGRADPARFDLLKSIIYG